MVISMKLVENCTNMNELRLIIDEIDRDLVAKIALRVECVEQAAKLKMQVGLPAHIPERIEAVIANVRLQAQKLGSNEDLVEGIWRVMIDWAVKHETNLMKDGIDR
jgi:isochorismate pyruvate lyase